MNQTNWPATKIEMRPIDALINYARNSRKHSDSQIDKVAASIREFGWTIPILIDEDNTIIAGHCRVMSAKKLNITEVPVMVAKGWSEAQRRAYVISDNQLTLLGEWDNEMLKVELMDLKLHDFDLGLTGFDATEIDSFIGVNILDEENDSEHDETYSKKIEAPIYQPSEKKPELSELLDKTKTLSLIDEINASKLPEQEKHFLISAANRHSVFNYRKIADYYAHSCRELQELMEKSALVIIDFNKAIEYGYVQLTKNIQDQYVNEYGDDDEE